MKGKPPISLKIKKASLLGAKQNLRLKDLLEINQKPQVNRMVRSQSKPEVTMGVVEFDQNPDNETTLLQRSRLGESFKEPQEDEIKPIIFNNYGKMSITPKQKPPVQVFKIKKIAKKEERKHTLPAIEIPIKPLVVANQQSPFFPRQSNSDRKSLCSRHREDKILKIMGGETRSEWFKGQSADDSNAISFGYEPTHSRQKRKQDLQRRNSLNGPLAKPEVLDLETFKMKRQVEFIGTQRAVSNLIDKFEEPDLEKPRKQMILQKFEEIENQIQRERNFSKMRSTLQYFGTATHSTLQPWQGYTTEKIYDSQQNLKEELFANIKSIDSEKRLQEILEFIKTPDKFQKAEKKMSRKEASTIKDILKKGHDYSSGHLLNQMSKESLEKIENKITDDLQYRDIFIQPMNMKVDQLNIFQSNAQKEQTQESWEERLKNLILNSPLKPLVEERILEQVSSTQKNQATLGPGGPMHSKDLPCTSISYLQMQALNEILESILLLKNNKQRQSAQDSKTSSVLDNQIKEYELLKAKIACHCLPRLSAFNLSPEWQQENQIYLDGHFVKKHLVSENKEIFFKMSQIRRLQSMLAKLPQTITRDNSGTFLTEHFPEDKEATAAQLLQDEDLQSALQRPLDYVYTAPSGYTAAMKLQKKENEDYTDLGALRESINQIYDSRQRTLSLVLRQMEEATQPLRDVQQTKFSFDASAYQRVLYLAFVENLRQIGKISRNLACNGMRIFHEYFDATQAEMKSTAEIICRFLEVYKDKTQKVVKETENELNRHREKDLEIAKLKTDLEKVLRILEFTQSKLYVEEARCESLRSKLDFLRTSLALVYPNSFKYIINREMMDVRQQMKREQQKKMPEDKEKLYFSPSEGEESDEFPADKIQFLREKRESKVLENKDRLNFQIVKFKRKIIKKYDVISAQDVVSQLFRHENPKYWDKWKEEQAEILENALQKLKQTNPDFLLPGEKHIQIEKKRIRAFETTNNQTRQLIKEQIALNDEQYEEVYQAILEDLERIINVIPVKTKAQKELERIGINNREMINQLDLRDRLIDSLKEQLLSGKKFIDKVLEEKIDAENSASKKISEMKIKFKEDLEREKLEIRNRILKQMKRETAEMGVMTTVDGEMEQILKQREFNQVLLKYRGYNQPHEALLPKLTKKQEEKYISCTPPIENIYAPIKSIMNAVARAKHKKRDDIKSIKNVLKTIAGLYQAKMTAMNRGVNDPIAMMNVDCFFYHHIQQTYGLDQLAHKYCDIYLASVEYHRLVDPEKRDSRIDLFARFVGLVTDRLPYSIFEKYTQMMRATGMTVFNLFAANLNQTFIEYQRVRHIVKEQLCNASDAIHKKLYTQFKACVKVTSSNMYIQKMLDIEEFEIFKDLHDQTIRSKYKTNAALLKAFLVQMGLYSEELDSESEDDPLSDYEDQKFVTKQQFAHFLLKNLDLTDYSRGDFNNQPKKTVDRLDRMLDRIFINGQQANPDKITPRQIGQAFREKIEMKIPLSMFFYIIINASAQHENDENMVLEKAYQFYTQTQVLRADDVNEVEEQDIDKDEQEQLAEQARNTPLVVQRVHYKLNLDGMSFLQFVLFLKDIECPLVTNPKKNWQAALEIYRTTCQFHSREKLICDDFIEALRKFRLISSLKAIEVAMYDREIEIANEMMVALAQSGKEAPKFLLTTASKKKLKNQNTSFAEAASLLHKEHFKDQSEKNDSNQNDEKATNEHEKQAGPVKDTPQKEQETNNRELHQQFSLTSPAKGSSDAVIEEHLKQQFMQQMTTKKVEINQTGNLAKNYQDVSQRVSSMINQGAKQQLQNLFSKSSNNTSPSNQSAQNQQMRKVVIQKNKDGNVDVEQAEEQKLMKQSTFKRKSTKQGFDEDSFDYGDSGDDY